MMSSSKHLRGNNSYNGCSKVGIWKVCAQEDERSDREERIPARVLNSQPGVSRPNCDHRSVKVMNKGFDIVRIKCTTAATLLPPLVKMKTTDFQ